MRLALIALAVALSSQVAAQSTIHVPQDHTTIQAAIAAASDGDTVLVEPGIYRESVAFLGKAIFVVSSQGSSLTTIEGSGPVVSFHEAEGKDSILEGFTITGGEASGSPGGGISCAETFLGPYASPTIRYCVITGNYGFGLGGGGVGGGSPTLVGCVVESNFGWGGGGLRGMPSLSDCVIANNSAGADWEGGGVLFDSSMSPGVTQVVVKDCLFLSNSGRRGGGAHVAAAVDFLHCVFTGNLATEQGAIYYPWGGAVGVLSGNHARLDSCSIVGNSTEPFFFGPTVGGIYGDFDMSSSVLRDNNDPQGYYQTRGSIRYSNVQGGSPGPGNIDVDPAFLDEMAGVFRLLPDSPCIDAGDPLSAPDPDGTRADMGAIPFDHIPACTPLQAVVSADAAFDHVGRALATSGPYVLAGAPDFDGPGFESGVASVLYRDGTEWIELPGLLRASDESAQALFGHSVALDGGVALIGARGDTVERGAAYIFRQQEDGTWAEESKLVASDGLAGDWLGSRVGIEGDVAVAAALHAEAAGANSGAAYVFRKTAGAWSQEQKLLASDGAAGDEFGKGLAISGSRILVGANGNDDAGTDSGSAYVYRDTGFGTGGFWVQEAKLVAADAASGAQFGNEVALDGDVAVVAARGAGGVGAVYVFRRTGFAWTQEQKLSASTPSAGAEFGSSVAIDGDRILVGARNDDEAAPNAGAAFLFERVGVTWVETAKYMLPEAAPSDFLGSAVALSGDYAMVGAEWADDPALDSGELWAFPTPGTCSPKITGVKGTSAQMPETLTASGFFLGGTQQVTIDGIPVQLIAATDVALTYQPQPGAPGDVPLEASGPDGTAAATQRLFPALGASTTGVGGALSVDLDNGDVGLYVLALALGSLPSPIPIASPPTWHGVLLNPLGPLFTIGTGAFATGEPVKLVYPVASNPALSGLPVHLQAWCQQGFFGPEVTYSFTNLASVAL